MKIAADIEPTAGFFTTLKVAAGQVEERYRQLTPGSARLFEEAQTVLPGGCARHGVFRNPYPTYIAEADGSTLTDVDGRRIIDFCFNATALPLGHAHPHVMDAVSRQLSRGTAYLSPTPLEIELATEIKRRLPSAERLIFANTGGEAAMTAIRLARSFTRRPIVAKFEGSFHGNYDDVLWSVAPSPAAAGPAHAPALAPASEGLLNAEGRTLVLPYNAAEDTERLIEAHAQRIAAVILEPMANRMGLVLPTAAFLHTLRQVCDRFGILLIFDEVLCFRNDYNGMQGRLGVRPDLTVLGKVIGGGFPVGAVGGREDVLALADPQQRRVYHTGTFAANPITLTAGIATLDLLTPPVFEGLNATADWLRDRLRQICQGLPLQITGTGSLFKISATATELTSYRATLTCDLEWQTNASLALFNDGFFFTPHLSGCIAITTTREQIEQFLDAFAALVAPGRRIVRG